MMRHRINNSPQRLGLFTQKLLKPTFKKRGLQEGKVITHWSTIVGEKFSRLALAEKITFPYGKRTEGTLHLHVTSSGALLLYYAQDMILTHVNTFFGYQAISKLRMTQGLVWPSSLSSMAVSMPSSPQKKEAWLTECLVDILDDELRDCLEKLGEGMSKQAQQCVIQFSKE